MATTTTPCICWTGPVCLHSGHCCFHPDSPDDCHADSGRELLALALPCNDCGAGPGERCYPLCIAVAAAQDVIAGP